MSYEYDGLDRLIIASLPDGIIQEYTYDACGNRTAKKENIDGEIIKETLYSYVLNSRLLTETAKGITKTYAYDKNGNMISRSDSEHTAI